ncbi:DUF4974 domain-containing protein [Chryseotalea sanaruensis]|uniref:DUF4974 domain-containing protein n=1 Tax=Chryseotalea sanaruensis TaxID=2482724 RepID=A0A401U8N5_9BACT|nr:FecR domain-containing protein [Chryseotalea sanaruensis]GCC51235.1 DUF4974 domain-containing protein [Chryseotalea sanaruensis]
MSAHDYDIDDLIGKYIAGEATAQEKQQVEEWCTQSADNQKYFEQLQTIFKNATLIADNTHYDADFAWKKVKQKIQPNQNKQTPWPYLRIAASVALIAISGFWAYQQFFSNTSRMTLASSAVVVKDSLPDGTKVVLNKQTEMSIAYDAKKKKGRIKLKGEASFEIKHDAEKEFIVEVEELLIRDIGTVFNVEAYPESNLVEVSVQEGEVHFYTQQKEGIFIKAGSKGVYDKISKSFTLQQADTNVIAYQTRQFVFEESDLQSVVDQLNAIYEKKIKISEKLKTCKVTVNFNNEDIDTIVEILAETLNLKIIETANEISLEGDGCE